MRLLGVRHTIRRLMVAVAIVAFLLACTLQGWRWHQRVTFMKKYPLGTLVIAGTALRSCDSSESLKRPELNISPADDE